MKLKRKVGEKGQVVIPKDIREKEGIKPDSEVYFTMEEDKIIIQGSERKLSETLREISRESEGSDFEEGEQVEKRMERAGIDV